MSGVARTQADVTWHTLTPESPGKYFIIHYKNLESGEEESLAVDHNGTTLKNLNVDTLYSLSISEYVFNVHHGNSTVVPFKTLKPSGDSLAGIYVVVWPARDLPKTSGYLCYAIGKIK